MELNRLSGHCLCGDNGCRGGMNEGYKLGSQNMALQELSRFFCPISQLSICFGSRNLPSTSRNASWCRLPLWPSFPFTNSGWARTCSPRLFDAIFPRWATRRLFRAGFMRIQGPYGHAITLGTMMVIGFRVARWLEWNGVWNEPSGFSADKQDSLLRTLDCSRKYHGSFCRALVGSGVRRRDRFSFPSAEPQAGHMSLILLIFFVGPPIYRAFNAYVSVDPALARIGRWTAGGLGLPEEAHTALHSDRRRAPNLGLGPQRVSSARRNVVDRQCLPVHCPYVRSLCNGSAGRLLVWPPIRLAIFSFPLNRSDPRALAAFTMIGFYVLNLVMDCTVSGGGTPWAFVFIIAGWSSALIGAAAPEVAETYTVRSWPLTQLGFRRVMA